MGAPASRISAAVSAVLVIGMACAGLSSQRPAPNGKTASHRAIATPAPTPPRQPQILFSTQRSTSYEKPKVWALGLDGRKVHEPALPPVRVRQHDSGRERIVYTIDKTRHNFDYFGCGVAGCTSGLRYEAASLAIAGSDGTGEVILADKGLSREPAFSPDGSRIAFIGHFSDDSDRVVIITPEDDRVRVLKRPNQGLDRAFAWAPDGERLAIVRQDNNITNERIDVVRADGTLKRTVATGRFEELVWDPDGRSLVAVRFGTDPRFPPGTGNTTGADLWRVSLDGSPPKRLTSFAPRLPSYAQVERCGNRVPRGDRLKEIEVSPDGRFIAFLTNYAATNTHEDFDIAVVRADGTGFRILRPAKVGPCVTGDGHERLNTAWLHDDPHILGWTLL